MLWKFFMLLAILTAFVGGWILLNKDEFAAISGLHPLYGLGTTVLAAVIAVIGAAIKHQEDQKRHLEEFQRDHGRFR